MDKNIQRSYRRRTYY